jgi:hypothetical protein
MPFEVVRQAIYWDVDNAVRGAVRGAVGRAMYRDVTDTVSRARRGAGVLREDPPHPGLGLYLGGVP